MKKFTNALLALSVAVFAATALTACDDSDSAVGNTFTLSNQ